MSSNFRSPLFVDSDQQYIGNSPGDDDRGRLHVKIANLGQEIIPVSADVKDFINVAGVNAVLTVTDTPVPLRVGATNLPDRRVLYWQALSGKIRIGFQGLTPTNGFRFFKDQFSSLALGPELDLWVCAEDSTPVDVVVGEAK